MTSSYSLLLNPSSGAIHVVDAIDWMECGSTPRSRCGHRLDEKSTVVAATSKRADIAKTDCCYWCKVALSISRSCSGRAAA